VLLVVAIGCLAKAVGVVIRGLGLKPASPVGFELFTALFVPASAAAYIALVRWLERRQVSELAGPRAGQELAVGLGAGAATFGLTIGVIAALGGYSVDGVGPASVLSAHMAMAVESGFVEELVTRGVIFRLLEEWLGTWAALAISAALFGLGHIRNPHATVWSAVAIAVEAGTLLAAAYMLTRRLWLAIGFHAAWNYTQGAIFGVAVSGHTMQGLLHGQMRGPAWLSGGEFGAEASVVAVVVCTSIAAWMLRRAVLAKGVVAPFWRRRALPA
jgi:membrane protease YdiL (CAAX protease family)